MNYVEATESFVIEPHKRFHIRFPNEPYMAMDENGMRISMRGFIPTFKLDQAFEIARKFNGEVN